MRAIPVFFLGLGLLFCSIQFVSAKGGGAGAAAAGFPKGMGAAASGPKGGAALGPKGGAVGPVPRGLSSVSAFSGLSSIPGSAATAMLRAARSGSSSSVTLFDQAGKIGGTLLPKGGLTGTLRNTSGENVATLTVSGVRVYFREFNSAVARGYAEEGANGMRNFYRLNETGEIFFDGSEPISAASSQSVAVPRTVPSASGLDGIIQRSTQAPVVIPSPPPERTFDSPEQPQLQQPQLQLPPSQQSKPRAYIDGAERPRAYMDGVARPRAYMDGAERPRAYMDGAERPRAYMDGAVSSPTHNPPKFDYTPKQFDYTPPARYQSYSKPKPYKVSPEKYNVPATKYNVPPEKYNIPPTHYNVPPGTY